jgi:Holliday junction DNA helicase RuvA
MIAQLTGRIDQVEADRCIVDVNGVGYLVQASTRTLAALPPAPAVTRLLIETLVREDAILLFGFADAAERDWFRLLTTVQGVGAKVALNILSALSPRDLVAVIAAGDRAGLTRAPGVGAKLAIRLLSELRDKVGAMPVSAASSTGAVFAPPASIEGDALSAMLNLGYRRPEAQAAIGRILERAPDASLDRVIRDALKELAPKEMAPKAAAI